MMEAFFGCDTCHDGSFSIPRQQPKQQQNYSHSSRRIIRRNVWSSNLQEENEWIDALLSRTPLLSTSLPRIVSSHHEDSASVIDAVANDTQHRDDGIPNISNTEIPKIIHFVWLGSDKKPIPSYLFLKWHDCAGVSTTFRNNGHNNIFDRVKKEDVQERLQLQDNTRWNECMHSWAKHHPSSRGWIIQLWTEEHIITGNNNINGKEPNKNRTSVSSFQLDAATMKNFKGYQYAMKRGNYGMASDIVRLEILNKFGGIYVDIDYWCIDSLDDIIIASSAQCSAHCNGRMSISPNEKRMQFFCGASNTGCIELNNGLLACRRKGHPIVWSMMQSIHSYFEELSVSAPSPLLLISGGRQDSIASLISSFFDSSTANHVEIMRHQGVDDKISLMEVIEHFGPGLLTRSVCRWIVNVGDATATGSDEQNTGCCNRLSQATDGAFDISQVAVFPSKVFHPFPNCLRNELQSYVNNTDGRTCDQNASDSMMSSPLRKILSFVSAETRAVHLWGCSWQEC